MRGRARALQPALYRSGGRAVQAGVMAWWGLHNSSVPSKTPCVPYKKQVTSRSG